MVRLHGVISFKSSYGVVFKRARFAVQRDANGQPKAPLGVEPMISCLLDRNFKPTKPQRPAATKILWQHLRVGSQIKSPADTLHPPFTFRSRNKNHVLKHRPKALLGFKPRNSCLLDRHFNQLSHDTLLHPKFFCST